MTLEESKSIKLSEHFTLYELIHTNHNIYNIPNKFEQSNLSKLVNNVLEPIRRQYGNPIIVTSGYRCPMLNNKVGGVSSSLHVHGNAVDFKSNTGSNTELMNAVREAVQYYKIDARTIIFEHCNADKTDCEWIHIDQNDKYHSYRNNRIVYA